MSQPSHRFAYHRVAAAIVALAALLPTASVYAQYGPHDRGRGRPDWHGQRGPQPNYPYQRQPQYNYRGGGGGGGNGNFIFGALLGAVIGTAVLGAMQPPPPVVYSAPPPPPPPGVYYAAPPPPPGGVYYAPNGYPPPTYPPAY